MRDSLDVDIAQNLIALTDMELVLLSATVGVGVIHSVGARSTLMPTPMAEALLAAAISAAPTKVHNGVRDKLEAVVAACRSRLEAQGSDNFKS